MNNAEYPNDWLEIAASVKAAAFGRCEWCGVLGEVRNDKGRQISVHHIDGDPKNSDRGNLVALCAKCHLREQGHLFRGRSIPYLEAMGQLKLDL